MSTHRSPVLEFDGAYVNAHHMALLCDRMTFSKKMISIFRHGINNDDIGPIAKASFEETLDNFTKAAVHGEHEPTIGVSASIICGKRSSIGTGCMHLMMDTQKYLKSHS